MKTIMSKSPHDSSFSFSRRYFNWKRKVEDEDHGDTDEDEVLTFSLSARFSEEDKEDEVKKQKPEKKHSSSVVSVSKLRTALTVFGRIRSSIHRSRLGARVVGTLFGYRRGHVYFALQEDPKLNPAFLIELSTPTSVLVREMASGLVRIALECEKKAEGKKNCKLLEEPLWRTFCNGKKCGYATRRECGAEEWKILKAVEPITMGAGVLPVPKPAPGDVGNGAFGSEGELMYMRARFERVVGSKDSEAFYMMNPDFSGGPELSVYLLRV